MVMGTVNNDGDENGLSILVLNSGGVLKTRTADVVRDDEGAVNGGGRLVENKNGHCCRGGRFPLVLVRTRTAIVVSIMTRGRSTAEGGLLRTRTAIFVDDGDGVGKRRREARWGRERPCCQ